LATSGPENSSNKEMF